MEAVKKIAVSLKNSPTGAVIGGTVGLIAAYRLTKTTTNKFIKVGGFIVIPVVLALMGSAIEYKIKYQLSGGMPPIKK